jgi:peptide chain release factor 3
MDPKHRDRIAFARVCSGRFERGMKLFHPRSGKSINIHTPVMFLAREREIAEEAYPGDIVGIPNHGQLRIGDALTEGERCASSASRPSRPSSCRRCAPAIRSRPSTSARRSPTSPRRARRRCSRRASAASTSWASPGRSSSTSSPTASAPSTTCRSHFQATTLHTARWLEADDRARARALRSRPRKASIADDWSGAPVFLAANPYRLKIAEEDWPQIRFRKTREHAE